MPPPRDVRAHAAPDPRRPKAATSSDPKKPTSTTRLSTRIQACQDSSSGRKRPPGVVRDYPAIAQTRSCSPVSSIDATSSTRDLSCAFSAFSAGRGEDRRSHRSSHCGSTHSVSVGALDTDQDGDLDLDSDFSLDPHKHKHKTPARQYDRLRPRIPTTVAHRMSSRVDKTRLGASTISSSAELDEIQQSVERLRAQRTHVEQLRQRNEQLERQLEGHNETSKALHAAQQENAACRQSLKLLEQRTRELEDTCTAKKLELQTVLEQFGGVEEEREQLLQAVKDAQRDHEKDVQTFEAREAKLRHRIEQLECHWKHQLQTATRTHAQELETARQESSKHVKDVEELEQQVETLLGTTSRQTAILEECDRVISECRAQQQQTQQRYDDQVQLNDELQVQAQRLEAQMETLKSTKASELAQWEKKTILLESKLAKRKHRVDELQTALQDKHAQLQTVERDFLTRDRSRFHLDETNKELRRQENRLKSEVSELQIALRDATDEKVLLADQVQELQEQLESERKDRSRWATARLKLLADFCDEESKLSSALLPSPRGKFDDWNGDNDQGHDAASGARRAGAGVRDRRDAGDVRDEVLIVDVQSRGDGDGDGKRDERRRGSIVFG